MIPENELRLFSLVFSQAVIFANEGRVPAGYRLLQDHLAQERRRQEPHAPELVRMWEAALHSFRKQFPADWYPEPEPERLHSSGSARDAGPRRGVD